MSAQEEPATPPMRIERPSISDVIDRLSRFDGPPETFLVNLLSVQCELAGVTSAAILRPGEDGNADVLAMLPPPGAPGEAPPAWLTQAAPAVPQALSTGTTVVKPLHGAHELYGQPPKNHAIVIPLRDGSTVLSASAFLVAVQGPEALALAVERLELTTSLLRLYQHRRSVQRAEADLGRLRAAMETLAGVSTHGRFAAAAMALCNELAARWQCERVTLGFHKGRYVQLRAMSHTEKFSRKMKVVQDLEAAMEECLDQDVEVTHPSDPHASYVSRSAAELSARHGPACILSLPIRHQGDVTAVLTLERTPDRPFQLGEVEALRLTCDLCAPWIVSLHEHDRWIGAKMGRGMRKGLAAAVGAKHTWIKVIVVLSVAVLAFVFFAKGEYTAEAPFTLEAIEQRVAPAPFDGILESVQVEPNSKVVGGKTVLATLKTSELKVQLSAKRKEQAAYLIQELLALRDEKTGEAKVARAQADEAAAQVRLFEYQIAKAEIIAPITGIVLTGDLKQQIGAPVKAGDVLFEIAPIESLRAELYVPEDQIAEVVLKQGGELATAAFPGRRIAFTVERINPAAEVKSQRNVFKVRVVLSETSDWMRPGMEGIAKISIDRRSFAWIWTRPLVNWLRMKLWI